MNDNYFHTHYEGIYRIVRAAVSRWRQNYFIPGADDDEYMQIAMIAAWHSLKNYYDPKKSSLATFLTMAVQCKLIAEMKRVVFTQKSGTLYEGGSLNSPPQEIDGAVRDDLDPAVYPDTSMEDRESLIRFWKKVYDIDAIRDEDKKIIPYIRRGYTIGEIHKMTGWKIKDVDNMRQRVIRKARRHFSRYRYDHEDELFGGKDGRA